MCGSAPKTPKVQDIAMRSTALMPDAGDPSVRQNLRAKRSLSASASILANKAGKLGMPLVSGPIGAAGL